VAVATAVAFACVPAAAQEGAGFFTGNDLWSHCPDKSAFSSGICLGFVAGIADVMGTGSAILGSKACIPEHGTAAQARDVVKRFLEQHPERRLYFATGLVADALADAFPCKP
jgi:Ssp1 endopeptidase immunity protein Rap1a